MKSSSPPCWWSWARLLQPHGAPRDALARVIDKGLGWLFRPFNRFFDRSAQGYQNSVDRSLRRRGLVFAVYAALLAGTAVLFHAVPGGFIPMQDKLSCLPAPSCPKGRR